MPERTHLVATILTAVRQIAVSEEFANDAAELAECLEDREAAAALRAMVLSRKTEAAIMRYAICDFAAMLAEMPIENG